METSSTKPKPKTVEEWRIFRKSRYSNGGKSGGMRILPRKVLDSDAFNELSNSEKLILILSLDQLDYWSRKRHAGEPKRDSSVGPLRNDGRFSLPNNLIKERGVKGSDTIAKARRKLVAIGFWETVRTGTLLQSGVFRWSDQWLTYNQRSPREREQTDPSSPPPGKCLYPNIKWFNDGRRAGTSDSHTGTSVMDNLGSERNVIL